MGARSRWWQSQTAQCEDATARAINARDGLAEAELWVRALIRRNAGDQDNLRVLLSVLTYSKSVNDEYLTKLRNERGELDALP